MDLVNPSINPPALQPSISIKRFSQHSRGHSRSPSHSPVRPYSPLSLDPLLRSLSPTATLYAFSHSRPHFEHDSRSPSPRRRQLKSSFSKVSDDQRDLGTRAAQACLDIRGWTRELAAWHWPGCFEEPEPARKKARISMMSIGSLASATTNGTADADDAHHQFLGSLPASTVHEYDARCQEVATGLDEIDMDTLKDFALQAHQSQSIDRVMESTTDIDDFTAVVTATVLQTLPYLSQLNRLLDTWMIRIAVLKQVPTFLDELDRLKRDLNHGWAAIAVSSRKHDESAALGARNMQDMQNLIDARMTALGSTLDGFLDLLEGQEDTVPEIFLDKFEELEQQYAEWVVTAQHRVLGDELKTFEVESATPVTPTAALLNGDSFKRAKTPTLHDIERARTPVLHESEGLSSPVFHEIERAKTPVIHEIDRAKTPVIDSFVAPVGQKADVSEQLTDTDTEQDDDDLVRETQKSRLLRASIDEGLNMHNPTRPEQMTALPQIKAGENTRAADSIASDKHEGANATPGHTLAEDSDISPDAGIILPAHDTPVRTTSRKGSILKRLFRRDKSPEMKRHSSVTSDASERLSRRDSSSNSLVQAARRSFSRKRTSKLPQTSTSDDPASDAVRELESPVPPLDRELLGRPSAQLERPSTMQHFDKTDDNKADLSSKQRPATAHVASPRPLTYQPRDLASRPVSTGFPENWPLSAENSASDLDPRASRATESTMTGDEDEEHNIRTVRAMNAINSDNFLDVFIGGFPAAPTSPVVERTSQADIAWARLQDGRQPEAEPQTPEDGHPLADSDTETPRLELEKVRVPIVTSSMLSSEGRQDDLSVARAISMDGLRQFERPKSYSDKEVTVAYPQHSSLPMQPLDLHPNAPMLNRAAAHLTPHPMTALPQSVVHGPAYEQPPQELPADDNHKVLIFPEAETDRSRQLSTDVTDDESGVENKDLLKRASTASIRAHAVTELRSIDVPPRKRDSTKLTTSQVQSEAQSPAADSTAGSRTSSMTYFNRQAYGQTSPRSGAQSPTGSMDTPNFSRLRSSSVDTDDHRSPLSITIAKRRLREAPGLATISPSGDFTESSPAEASAKEVVPVANFTESPPAAAPAQRVVPADNFTASSPAIAPAKKVAPADNFDRHVSEVLQTLPAPIRFRNRAGDDIGTASPARSSTAKALRPRSTLAQRQISAGGLTLAPAESTPRRSAPSDPEIKLYHLTQAGREEPIKLFVRLVGEGERVMVRVGGGWSDLADFLRQYAEHHGSRTVSGSISGLELQTATNSPAGSRRTSGAVPTLSERRGRPASRDGQTPIQQTSVSNTVSNPVSVIDGIVELPGSLPPGAHSPTISSAKQNGKLGRKASKDALSDQKARWVTRMLEKAKRETAPAKTNKDGSFGSMGRIGSTRRVFFSSPGSRSSESATLKKR